MSNDDLNNTDEGGFAGLIEHGIFNYMKDVHTCSVGKIVSFDEAKQSAEVQPLINRIFTVDGAKPLPKLINVRVMFLRAGGFTVTPPIKPDDECVIFFTERSIDRWVKNGGLQDPGSNQMHALSGSLCWVGVFSELNLIENYNPDDFEIRNDEGDQLIKLKVDKDIELITGDVEVKMSNANNEISLAATTKVTIDSPLVECTTDLKVSGNLEVEGDTTVTTITSNNVDISNLHTHPGVTTGGGTTGPVTP